MNESSPSGPEDGLELELNIPYTVCEALVAVIAIIGNAMVIWVFRRERRLRRRTNYYIVSLAGADFLVGLLGIPFAILASVGLPTNIYACLFTVSLLVVLCTISIFCLVAVSIDRYWAILHPMGYSRNVRTKTALVIISLCWASGSFIGFLPLLGWHSGVPGQDQKCFFVRVMDYNYLVFLYFATIITPALLLAAFYAHIYRVVLKQLRQMVAMNPGAAAVRGGSGATPQIRIHGGTMLRMLGAAQKREVKATQNLSIIVLFFMVCWIPLYTINCVQAFCVDCRIDITFTNFCIILSHANSAVNPLLYAYHLRDFRAALKNLIYQMLGIRSKNGGETERACRPSLNSLNCSQQYRRPGPASAASLRPRPSFSAAERGRASVGLPACLPIVSGTAALAVSTAALRRRDMWMIREVSSAASEPPGERCASVFPDGPRLSQPGDEPPPSESGSSNTSGNLNTGYVDELIDDLEIGEDEVFYADASTFSANDLESDTSEILRRNDCGDAALVVTGGGSKKNGKIWCLSSSSPQLSRTVYLVDGAAAAVDTMVKNERRSRTPLDRKRPNLSASGDLSPAKTLRLSPVKAVGEFLLHHNANKCAKLVVKNDN